MDMPLPPSLAFLLIGLLTGVLVGLAVGSRRRQALVDLLTTAESQRQAETDALLDGVKLAFADISADTFRRAGDDVTRLAHGVLQGERRIHGERLAVERAELEARMTTVLGQLERMQHLVRELEQDRSGKFGELAAQLAHAGEGAERLQRTTERLSRALSNARARGQWGERMAEDLIRALGLVEGTSYFRQRPMASGSRPDFTFVMPGERVVHMDVKFPFDNLLKSLEAPDAAGRQRLEQAFVRDVRQKITEVVQRGYVAPDQGTLDLALLFIPNEGVFRSMLELDAGLLEDALAHRVVLVSPVTCFAVLAVLRHLARQWELARHGRELVRIVDAFRQAWDSYRDKSQAVENRLEQVLDEVRHLNGRRRRAVDRTLDRLGDLDHPTGDERPPSGP
ncbi:MAG: DNA recombination protein RmuC [Geminicoccaceae bacterium]|nr:DNA recombination protein RmuC [Geminicoccaceae bacterium]